MKLFHFTCAHSVDKIRRTGILRPWRQPMLEDVELVWLTDLEDPTRAQLGLTSNTITCDRMEYRVLADAPNAQRWTTYARDVDLARRRALEFADGVMPAHWWVSLDPVRVLVVEP